MRMSPLYLILDRDFFFYEKDAENKKAQFVRAGTPSSRKIETS